MNENRRRGPKRRYDAATEAQQVELAKSMAARGASWSEIIVAFGVRGWNLSQTTLKLRFAEWGIGR